MTRPISRMATLALCGFLIAAVAAGQDVETDALDGAQDSSTIDAEFDPDAEYYVVEEDTDIWPDDPVSEEDWAEELEAEDPEPDDTEEARVRPPHGLPYFEAVASDQPPVLGQARRSFGGVRVDDGVAPWQAQIYYPKDAEEFKAQLAKGEKLWAMQHYCGGALIASNWVLTAAHCIDNGMMKAGYRIRLGQERIDLAGGWSYKIDRVVRYASYVPLKGGDIALIHIVNDQGFAAPPTSQVRPIGIFRGKDAAVGDPMTAFGWGRTGRAGETTHSILLQVSLNIIDRPTCDKARIAVVDGRIVCAAAKTRKTCSNDSGGPLINASRELVGIVSSGGQSCAADGVPGVYTRVAAYLPWIRQVTGGVVR
jgi:Trypsin